uniref:Tetraspannin domain containing protein n=1 Tax=Haemonchus contortus TaxID=6289 RepID=A0A7I4YKQ0_HAECO
MAQRLERTARALCLALNTVFFLLSICLIAFVCLAAINAPKPDISPQPLNTYPQYIITILLIASYSCSLFCLSAFGFVSLCLQGSFLMSIYVLGQLAMIAAQVVAVAFTVTVRKRLHYKLEETWRARPECAQAGECLPVRRFLNSETLLIVIFCSFLFLQVVLLVASAIVCEQRSYEERKRLLKEREEEDDDDEY